MAEFYFAATRPEDGDETRKHGIAPVDLVVVNLYPFEATAARAGVTAEELIENIDIGGPAMVRSAAKNFESVAVVTDPATMPASLPNFRNGTIGPCRPGWRWRARPLP